MGPAVVSGGERRRRAHIEETDIETGSFEALAKEAIPKLYGMARRLGGDDAEDLVQECLVKAYRSFDTLEDPSAGIAWMRSILVNAFKDRLRAQSRRVEEVSVEEVDDFSLYRTVAEEDPFPYSNTLHADFLGSFAREDVHAVLLRLPQIYRAPLVLRYMDGYATKEIARLLDLPLGTVLAQLHRGRKLFEQAMWTYAEESGIVEKEGAR